MKFFCIVGFVGVAGTLCAEPPRKVEGSESLANTAEVRVTRDRRASRPGKPLEYSLSFNAAGIGVLVWKPPVRPENATEEQFQAWNEATHKAVHDGKMISVAWSDVEAFDATLTKFHEWREGAAASKAEPFKRAIATIRSRRSSTELVFHWTGRDAFLSPLMIFDAEVAELLEMLREELPGAKKEIQARAIAKEKPAEISK